MRSLSQCKYRPRCVGSCKLISLAPLVVNASKTRIRAVVPAGISWIAPLLTPCVGNTNFTLTLAKLVCLSQGLSYHRFERSWGRAASRCDILGKPLQTSFST